MMLQGAEPAGSGPEHILSTNFTTGLFMREVQDKVQDTLSEAPGRLIVASAQQPGLGSMNPRSSVTLA